MHPIEQRLDARRDVLLAIADQLRGVVQRRQP
jgi:hypothetical protein